MIVLMHFYEYEQGTMISKLQILKHYRHVFPLYLTDTHESGGENKVLQ